MSDRKNFFFQQLVTEAELDAGFDDLEDGIENVVNELLGDGFIVAGATPATVVENDTPDLNVKINRLLGYDQLGRRLTNELFGFKATTDLGAFPQVLDLSTDENAVSTAVGSGGNEKIIAIFVEFTRKQQDQRTDGNNQTVFFEQKEAVKFNVVQSAEAGVGTAVPPTLRADQLLLADITLIFGQTAILNSDIDQTRREDFVLDITHGSSQIETGADPSPNATTTVGGLLSAADKVKLDGVTAKAFSQAPAADLRPDVTNGNVTMKTEVVASEGEIYAKVTGNAATQIGFVTHVFKMLTLTIGDIKVPHKFTDLTGSNDVIIRVIDSDGTVLATSNPAITTIRTETTILGTALSTQPTDRFLVEIEVDVDNADIGRVGGVLVNFA